VGRTNSTTLYDRQRPYHGICFTLWLSIVVVVAITNVLLLLPLPLLLPPPIILLDKGIGT